MPFKGLFENQRHVLTQNARVVDFRLALSKLKKINNVWVLDREELLSGDLYRRTIELDSNYFLDEVVASVERFFVQRQGQELFRCSGLDCGSSNAWANNYFKVKLLYGLDPSQAYRVWKVTLNNSPVYVSSYVVKRGNKRLYAHIDVLVPERTQGQAVAIPPDPESVAYALKKVKYYLVPQLEQQSFATTEALLQPLVAALQANPMKKVVVVGHDFLGDTPEARKQNSLTYAKNVVRLLQEQGINQRRLSAQGLGSLVPQLNVTNSAVYLVIE